MVAHAPQAPMAPGGSPQPPALPPGARLLNRFVIEGYIGGGGFGHIYRAHDLVFGYRRAIKEAFYRDPGSQQQFHYEAEFLINARHPNLVQAYLVFSAGGRLYLVMDYVDGKTLEDIAIEMIRRTGRTPTELQVLDWVLPICDAVHTLHTQPRPIIHRDIKPANIKLSDSRDIPILIDLGLAKLFHAGRQTQAAALAFTPGYAPPEQYQAVGATDQRTDVYGMGATLFFLLTGYQPTEAPARLSAQAQPLPRALNPLLTPAIEHVVIKAMELDPTRRYQTMRELENALFACREALAIPLIEVISSRRNTQQDATEIEALRRPAANPIFEASATDALQTGANATNPAVAASAPISDDLDRPAWQEAISAAPPVAQPDRSQIVAHLPSRPARRATPDPIAVSPAQLETPLSAMPLKQAGPHSPASPVSPAAGPAGSAHLNADGNRPAVVSLWSGWMEGAGRLAAHPSQRETVGVFAAFIALVCLALSLTAFFAHIMALFLAPSLLLSLASVLTLHDIRPSREFWWLGIVTLIMGTLWLVIWLLAWSVWLR